MKIEKIPEGYLLARKGGNGCELWRKFNGAESMACDAIDELIAERDELRAKVAEMEKQRPAAWCATDETGTVVEALGMNQSRRFDTALYLSHGAQNVPKAVAYLDLGTGGYMDIGTDLTDEALAALPKGRHMLGIVGTYGVDGYVPAQPAPSVPDGWLRAIDEALVVAHIGVANAEDTYEQAKAKLDSLIKFHVDVAIDPAVNGGWKLMPVEPTKEIYECFSAYDGTSYSNPFGFDEFSVDYAFALEAAPEAK